MPIYEYICQACGHETEILHGISEAPPKKCPACGKPKLTKLVSAAAFRLKGGGWYETDFKSGYDKKRNLVSDTEPAKSEGGEGQSETKSAAKPATKPVAKPAAKATKKAAKSAPRKPKR